MNDKRTIRLEWEEGRASVVESKNWRMGDATSAYPSMCLEELGVRFLIRDRDRKFLHYFDVYWKDSGVRVIKTPPCAPRANTFCESFIGTLKKYCSNHFVCFSRSQLDYINRTWLDHYHHERPHRGVGRDNTVLDENFVPKTEGPIRCKTELGGLLKSYYREAA